MDFIKNEVLSAKNMKALRKQLDKQFSDFSDFGKGFSTLPSEWEEGEYYVVTIVNNDITVLTFKDTDKEGNEVNKRLTLVNVKWDESETVFQVRLPDDTELSDDFKDLEVNVVVTKSKAGKIYAHIDSEA